MPLKNRPAPPRWTHCSSPLTAATPGLVVGVAQRGRPLYRRGFGLASIELGVANTPWTRMRIGSTSKHFTCLAALLLAEEGKLDIDTGVRRYFPACKRRSASPRCASS